MSEEYAGLLRRAFPRQIVRSIGPPLLAIASRVAPRNPPNRGSPSGWPRDPLPPLAASRMRKPHRQLCDVGSRVPLTFAGETIGVSLPPWHREDDPSAA